MATRRALLLAGAALPLATFAGNGNVLAAAWDDAAARHWVGLVRVDTEPVSVTAAIEVPTRAHGLALDGDGNLLALARRPGEWLLRWRPGARAQWLWADAERRFNGHALVHARGIYTTETDLESGDGVLVRRQAHTLEAIQAWPTGGRDPHDLEALPDGTLLVANGGIDTRPETGRTKHGLTRMDPSLVRVDPRNGARLGQWRLPDSRLSIRHLASDALGGTVGVALQAEHDDADDRARAPVFALFDARTETFSALPPPAVGQGYAGDVAACGNGWAVSRPRDNDVLILRKNPSESRSFDLAEGCALVSHGQGVWAMGAGRVALLPDAAGHAVPELRFDNHALIWRA